MSMMDGNDCDELIGCFKREYSSDTAGRLILVVGSVYYSITSVRRQIAGRPLMNQTLMTLMLEGSLV